MLNQIAIGIADTTDGGIPAEYSSKGEFLQDKLVDICSNLGLIARATEGKANITQLLSIVGAYLLSMKQGKLDTDHKKPYELFDEFLLPAIKEMEESIDDGTTIESSNTLKG